MIDSREQQARFGMQRVIRPQIPGLLPSNIHK
jgi:hypothetical protein